MRTRRSVSVWAGWSCQRSPSCWRRPAASLTRESERSSRRSECTCRRGVPRRGRQGSRRRRPQHRKDVLDEGHAAGHPLVVAATAVAVRTVQAGAREALEKPAKERLVAHVHAQGDLGLLPVATERPLADQDADDDTAVKGADGFHRPQSRKPGGCCFTVEKNVKRAVSFSRAATRRAGGAARLPRCAWSRHRAREGTRAQTVARTPASGEAGRRGPR